MSIQAINPGTLTEPQVAFDKVGFGLHIETEVEGGKLVARGRLVTFRFRVLSDGRQEEEPGSRQIMPVRDWFTLAAQYPAVAAAWGALETAVAAVNADKKLA